jgi:hypothetical protein
MSRKVRHVGFRPQPAQKLAPEARHGDRKHYQCLRNKHPSRPYELIGFGAIDVATPYKFIWCEMHGPDLHLLTPTITVRHVGSYFMSIRRGPRVVPHLARP